MFGLFKRNNKNFNNNDPVASNAQENFTNITPIADYFKSITGITFENQKSILQSKLISFCINRNIKSFNDCLQKAKTTPNFSQELINYLTTNESYFYREVHQINEIVNKLASNSSKVDILCAPCSTGEESYSLAIALLNAGIAKNRFKIKGIDINTEALDKAKHAVYNERNISKVPPNLVEKYFQQKNNTYHLNDNIKQLVQFKKTNIFEPSFKQIGKFDYIFSRNMLIYFDAETKVKARNILESLLKKTGNIYYGHADLF